MLTFTIENNNFFLVAKQTSFLSLFNKQSKSSINSLGFFHCYLEELIKKGLIDSYMANPTMPVVWLSTYDFRFIEKIAEYVKPKNYLTIDLCQENEQRIEVMFEKSIDDIKRNKIVDCCNNNGLTIITTSADLTRYVDDIRNDYQLLFLNYLKDLENISKEIPKTIFVIKFEDGVLSPEHLTTIHQSIKRIKNNGHIVIFNFHSYGDISDNELNIFSENLYEHYIISTNGTNNDVLNNLPNKNLYKHLPQQLKTLLSDPKLKTYNKHKNYYHKSHQVSIINTEYPKICILE